MERSETARMYADRLLGAGPAVAAVELEGGDPACECRSFVMNEDLDLVDPGAVDLVIVLTHYSDGSTKARIMDGETTLNDLCGGNRMNGCWFEIPRQ